MRGSRSATLRAPYASAPPVACAISCIAVVSFSSTSLSRVNVAAPDC
jgi:hypothetical protein